MKEANEQLVALIKETVNSTPSDSYENSENLSLLFKYIVQNRIVHVGKRSIVGNDIAIILIMH